MIYWLKLYILDKNGKVYIINGKNISNTGKLYIIYGKQYINNGNICLNEWLNIYIYNNGKTYRHEWYNINLKMVVLLS